MFLKHASSASTFYLLCFMVLSTNQMQFFVNQSLRLHSALVNLVARDIRSSTGKNVRLVGDNSGKDP